MLRYIAFSCCVVLCVGHDLQCGSKEELTCVHPCPPEVTCRNRFLAVSCVETYEPCKPFCACKEGLLRNAVGDCITLEECEMCDRENEYFECGSFCDNECATLGEQNKTNCPVQSFVCNRKCYCEDGFARDDEGNCVPVEKCPTKSFEGSSLDAPKDAARVRRYTKSAAPICKDENEVFTDCKKSCPPDTCLSIVARFKCDSKEPCKKGCVCKPGYLRQTPDSPCIPLCQCNEMKNSPDCPK
ncbi:hypothetical protein PYW07_015163 [Mythimna separata]|uniref:TIL domain-containing protein n=1 Tax=Mythimna separata TaxID=271217 RepID=A0AAD7YX82_MYTSE|nr:hypothetical protein PYW07_015163 [Mythimna separata]